MSASAQPVIPNLFGFTLHKQSIVRQGGAAASFSKWLGLGSHLQQVERAVQWWVGDWLVYGELTYGEKYAQGVGDLEGVTPETLKQYQWVADRVVPARRRPELSWSHHREVADLPPRQQADWLGRAVTSDWSANRLRRELAGENGEPGAPSLWLVVGCRSAADQERLAKSMEADGRTVKKTSRKRTKKAAVARVKTRRAVAV